MKRILFLVIIMVGCISALKVSAQVDPHFSQYYIQPATLNPALTGAMQGDYRVSAIWKNQYANTLSSRGVAAEMATNRNLNAGINVFNQASSDHAYSYTTANISLAYTGVRFNNHYISMALQAGVINRYFNINKLQFGDQWTAGIGYSETNAGQEVFNKPSVTVLDAGAGVMYYDATPEKKVNVFAGFSAFHLSRPSDPFISGGEKEKMPVRYSLHGGAKIMVNDLFSIVPNFLYMRQGEAEEKVAGAYLQVNASEKVDLLFGANLRFGNAFIPFAGFFYKGLTVGMSYDTNISNKTTAALNRNSAELSLSYTWWQKKSTQTKMAPCPRF
ncbi:MAG: PorP/SprF family type IX secretion system membrane protein [Agriterribacter sp.]